MAAVEGVTESDAEGAEHETVTAVELSLSQFAPDVTVAVTDPPAYRSLVERPDKVHELPLTVAVPSENPSI